MNTYQIVFLVTCFLLAQLSFVWAQYSSHDFVVVLASAVILMDAVIALVVVAAAATWLYEYLGTLS